MKICLDTNFIWGWFENSIKAYRKNLEDYRTGKFNPTKKMEFLVEAKHELFVANVAKAEVFRKLFTELSVPENLCRELWTNFIDTFYINILKINEVDFDEVAEMCLMSTLGKGSIPNLIQLQYAKKSNFTFATGDGAIKENYTNYYLTIFTYVDLKKLFDASKSLQSS